MLRSQAVAKADTTSELGTCTSTKIERLHTGILIQVKHSCQMACSEIHNVNIISYTSAVPGTVIISKTDSVDRRPQATSAM